MITKLALFCPGLDSDSDHTVENRKKFDAFAEDFERWVKELGATTVARLTDLFAVEVTSWNEDELNAIKELAKEQKGITTTWLT